MAEEDIYYLTSWLLIAFISLTVGVGTFILYGYYTAFFDPIYTLAFSFTISGLITGIVTTQIFR